MNKEQAGYSEQTIPLSGIHSLYEVSGDYARFFISPGMIDGHLTGYAPKARFIRNSHKVYVPSDTLSQQMALVYAHMERLAALDATLGVGNLNHWPRDIGLGVRMMNGMENNAFYDGGSDSMLFVPYSEQNLPIIVNAGVLAHEHFHSLFFKIVVKPSQAESKSAIWSNQGSNHNAQLYENSLGLTSTLATTNSGTETKDLHFYYHVAMLRGLNEGLADYWGWVYTGDPEFLAPSLPVQRYIRSLAIKTTTLMSSALIQREIGFYINATSGADAGIVSYAYMLGTQFSRILKGFADVYAQTRSLDSVTARQSVAKAILQALPAFRTEFKPLAEGQNDYYLPAHILLSIAAQIPDLRQAECKYLESLINSSQGDSARYACQAKDKEATTWTLQPAPPETLMGRVVGQ